MADRTAIEWTDATVNFWWGCTKVGPGCDFCYAETLSNRFGGQHWGVGAPRRKIKGAVALLHRLDNGYADWAADRECAVGNAKAFGLPVPTTGIRRRVFIQSMSDLFDLEVDLDWFAEAWSTIETCDRLAMQILTKRISAVEKRLGAIGRTTWPRHAGLMITVVNQDEANRDIPRLLALKAKLDIPWVGLSVEPMLGPINLAQAGFEIRMHSLYEPAAKNLNWIIVGGESGPGARPMQLSWLRSIIEQCRAAGVPCFAKQLGRFPETDIDEQRQWVMRDRKGGDWSEWPEDLRVREFPA